MNGFEIGKKVVCVDTSNPRGYGDEIRIVKGAIYTIRAHDTYCINGIIIAALLFDEVHNRPRPYQDDRGVFIAEVGYRASRFRPLLDDRIEAMISALEEGHEEPELIETL
jgi:hypothetical protein